MGNNFTKTLKDWTSNPLFYDLIFLLLLLTSAYFYQYFEVLNTPPNGIHNWRQTDGASIAYIYYEQGNSFFSPEMHNRLAGEGKAVGEFPIMYYLVSIFYHIFGFHHWIYRAVWALTTLSGIFFLYKVSVKLLKDHFWAGFVALSSFASPVFAVYGISFMPDPIALSFIFISWYFLYSYIEERSRGNHSNSKLILTILFVTLAALLKITSFISILAIGMVLCMVLAVQRIRYQITTAAFFKKLSPFLLVFILIILWYRYAANYNEEHQTSYFFMKIAPIWDVIPENFEQSKERILGWMREYYYPSGLHVLYVMAGLVLIPFLNRKLKYPYYSLFLFSLIGLVIFVVLFYSQFEYHDYYVINLLFIIPLTYLCFLKKYLYWIEKYKVLKYIFRLGMCVLLILNVIHTHKRTVERFAFQDGWLDNDLYELRSRLDEFGINKNDLVLVPHDPSPNITLYAINLKGWTQVNSILNPEIFKEKVKLGAKYMIVSDPRFYDNPIIDPYRDDLVVDFKGIRIYSLE